MSTDQSIKRETQRVIDLWKKGKDAWNDLVEKHPEADIDFSGVDFGQYRNDPDCHIPAHEWPFAGFHFRKGAVSFEYAQFGEGAVSFRGAQFREGAVSFRGAQFREGNVSFEHAQFGEGNVSFEEARFDVGDVSFINAQFGKGAVNFSYAQFEGDVFFSGQFGRETKHWTVTDPCDEPLSRPNGARFGTGDVTFRYAKIKGDFYFTGTTIEVGKYNFEGCDFERRAFFDGLRNVEQVESFSFRYASFEKPLVLSTHNNKPFGCAVDLTDTRISSHVSLQGLNLQPKKTTSDDIRRFCRLKELAEGQKDHESALEFRAQEMRAIRRHEAKGMAWLLNGCFDKVSDYGRSELRPLVGLVGIWGIFGLVYRDLSPAVLAFWPKLWEGLIFSINQMFPLIPGFRESRTGALKTLFPDIPSEASSPLWLSALTLSQSLLTIVLLFLLGLALRNRFRL